MCGTKPEAILCGGRWADRQAISARRRHTLPLPCVLRQVIFVPVHVNMIGTNEMFVSWMHAKRVLLSTYPRGGQGLIVGEVTLWEQFPRHPSYLYTKH